MGGGAVRGRQSAEAWGTAVYFFKVYRKQFEQRACLQLLRGQLAALRIEF